MSARGKGETKTGSAQYDGKRRTSASHLDGKIPLILEIRTESPRQGALAPQGSPVISSLPPLPHPPQQTRLCWPHSRKTHFREPPSPKNTTQTPITHVSKQLLMANLGNQNNSRLPYRLSLSSTYSPSSYYHDAGGGDGSVYFLLIRAAHYRSFTARGVGSQSVICVHSTPAPSIMVSGLS